MRNEMTIFKAILRENLPDLCDKLRLLGLPIEHLIYDSIATLYSNFFSSQVVSRLWDLIFFNMSTREKAERRRALWYIMAPAYLVLREK
jgi:Rab-GTPase-TBC domain